MRSFDGCRDMVRTAIGCPAWRSIPDSASMRSILLLSSGKSVLVKTGCLGSDCTSVSSSTGLRPGRGLRESCAVGGADDGCG
jgi:hypothetical protein